jgi:phage repressor protein C with HTH and peptisase S24 domain
MEDTPATRLQNLRKAKGFKRAEDAAQRYGWSVHTYLSHENGSRGITEKRAKIYAEKYGSTPGYIMFNDAGSYDQTLGRGGGMNDDERRLAVSKIPVWGTADAQDGEKYAINMEDTPIDYIEPLPQQKLDGDAYAILISGESMSPALKPGYIACVNTRKVVTRGSLCVVEFNDGGGWIKEFNRRENGFVYVTQYNPQKELRIDVKDVARLLPVVGFIIRS